MTSPGAVTFDFGQVLASFDPHFLAQKLSERGIVCEPSQLDAGLPDAWAAYGAALRTGGHGAGAWGVFVRVVLARGGVGEHISPALLEWLFTDQRKRNLWRKPVAGMIELVRALRASGIPVGIVSNSEGALAALIAELGWEHDFDCVADSGVLGLEKPSPAIFAWAAERLGTQPDALVHIGDSWAADVEGALACNAKAIWFVDEATERATPAHVVSASVRVARDAASVAAALRAFGVTPRSGAKTLAGVGALAGFATGREPSLFAHCVVAERHARARGWVWLRGAGEPSVM